MWSRLNLRAVGGGEDWQQVPDTGVDVRCGAFERGVADVVVVIDGGWVGDAPVGPPRVVGELRAGLASSKLALAVGPTGVVAMAAVMQMRRAFSEQSVSGYLGLIRIRVSLFCSAMIPSLRSPQAEP